MLLERMDGKDKGRSERRKTQKAKKSQQLGRVAQAAISHNDALVEEFIETLEAGEATPYVIGIVQGGADSSRPGTWAFGSGAFSVKMPNGSYVRAHLRRLLQGRGKFHHNPEVVTAVREGSHVIIEDLGLSLGTTHQIMGVMSGGQASRALRASASASLSANSIFSRSSEERRDAAMRSARLATLNRQYRNTKKNRSGSNHSGISSNRSSSSINIGAI